MSVIETGATNTDATGADAPVAAAASTTGGRRRLVTAELRKIFTTNTWWLFGIFILLATGLALLINTTTANQQLDTAEWSRAHPLDFASAPPGQRPTASQQQELLAAWAEKSDVAAVLARSAGAVYTSGQYLGMVLVLIVGVLLVTNEFAHQTATATFLGTPRRTPVIGAKFATAAILGAAYWAVSTVFAIGVGALDFSLKGYGVPFVDPLILRSVGMNLLGYVLWAVLGVGFGVLIRNQIGATITAAALYVVTLPAALLLFGFLRQSLIHTDAVFNYIVLVPGVASLVMVNPEAQTYGDSSTPLQWWVGALVLVGYTTLSGVIGSAILRRRDIS